MNRMHIGWLMALALLVSGALPAVAAMETLWSFQPAGEQFDASLGVGDLNGDGMLEFIAPTIQGSVIALDAEGKELWRWHHGDVISAPPAVADLLPEDGLETVVLTNTGKIFCLNGHAGAPLWTYELSGNVIWGGAGVSVSDLDGDGKQELVTADSKGRAVALRADGGELWRFEEAAGLKTAPTVADLNGDGKPEVLLGAMKAVLICLNAQGKELWRSSGETAAGGASIVADLDNDGTPEILAGTADGLSVYGADGQARWSAPLKGGVDSGLSVADIDRDGKPEVAVTDVGGNVTVFEAAGAVRWTALVGERIRRSASIADVDGDGNQEVLVAGYGGQLQVFGADGSLKDKMDLGGPSNATAAAVDLRGNGLVTLLCPTVTGSVLACRWAGASAGQILWPEYRFNSLRTGAVKAAASSDTVRITTMDPGRAYVGRNEFNVAVENPKHDSLKVVLEVRQDGRPNRKEIIATDATIQVSMAYILGGRTPSDLEYVCTVTRGEAPPLAQQSRRMRAIPFAAELAELSAAVAQLDRAAAALPEDEAETFAKEALYWRTKLPTLRDRSGAVGLLSSEELGALSKELDRARTGAARLAAVAAQRLHAKSRLLVSAANPWANFGGIEELSEGRVKPPACTVEAFSGEIESAALNVFNLGGAPLTLRVEAGQLTGPNDAKVSDAIILREAVAVPTQTADTVADALPTLNQGQTLIVPAFDGRQLYLEVETKDLAPGDWTAEVRLRGLDTAATEAKVTLNVTVWPAKLPEKQTLGLCHWGYVHSSVLKDQPKAAVKDQVRHGTNVFVSVFPPKATFDKDGNLAGDLDYTEHDAYLDQYAQYGLILFSSYDGGLRGPEGAFSDSWNKAHVEYLRRWVAHLEKRGMDYKDWALYTIDEPGLKQGLVDIHIKLGKLAREADPKIQIYTDPVGDASLEDLKNMAPYVDIWCPHRNGIVNRPDQAKMEFIKSTGKTVFTYECQGDVKHRSPTAYYRGQAWLAWMHELQAVGFWTYCTSQYDPWFSSGEPEYLLIYQGKGVVPSKRWHAVRDGIEDHGMLTALKSAADDASNAGRAADAVSGARRLLETEAGVVARYCGLDDDGELPGAGGLRRQRQVEDRRWERVNEIRREIAKLLDALK